MNLEQIIDLWLYKHREILVTQEAYDDLKSRKQELIEGIVKYMIDEYGTAFTDGGYGSCISVDLKEQLEDDFKLNENKRTTNK